MNTRPALIVCATLVATLPCPPLSGQGIIPKVDRVPPRLPTPAEAPPAPDKTPADEQAAPSGPRPIRPADYGKWESLRRPLLSPDGRWLAYQISRSNEKNELRLRMLATDATEAFEHGSRPAFSADGRWLAFIIGVSPEQRERAATSGEPAPQKLGLHNLVDGRTDEIENVAGFSFSDDGGCLVIQRPRDREQENDGIDVVVRHLETGVDTGFGNVKSHAWTDDGSLVAMIIDTEDGVGNGVQVFDPRAGRLHTLDSARNGYATMAWREDGNELAVLRLTEHDAKKDEDPSHVVIAWRDLDTDEPRRRTYDHRKHDGFPEGMRVVDFAGLRWSDDGETIFFGIAPWERKPAEKQEKDEAEKEKDEKTGTDEKAEDRPARGRGKGKDEGDRPLRETLKEPSNVEVWHAGDVDIIPLQKRTAGRDRRESHLAAWWPETGAFVRLGTELTEDVALMEGHKRAIGMDNTPHEPLRMFGPTLHDLYVIDVATGDRRKILEAVKYHDESCATGRYLLVVRDEAIWSYDLDTDAMVNLTGELEPAFVNQEMSNLTDEKPPYGFAGWTEDGAHVLAYDRFDVWMLAADGSAATRLTRGGEDMIRHRRLVLDREAEEFVDPDATMYLTLYGELTKKSGYGRLSPGNPPEVLRWDDRMISGLVKAEDADVYAWIEQRFDDSPDVYVGGDDLAGSRQVTRTNPFQD
ncbi:MAG: TolB family protein, partial [Planctomycetota bacterium]